MKRLNFFPQNQDFTQTITRIIDEENNDIECSHPRQIVKIPEKKGIP